MFGFINGNNNLFGGLFGVVVAIFIGYLIFVASKKIDVKKFFNISSVLLLLFGAGLFAHGIHEFQEAGLIPTIIEHVWDVNYILNENGTIGSLAKGLFGYNGNPSLIEVFSYLLYLTIVFGLYKYLYSSKS